MLRNCPRLLKTIQNGSQTFIRAKGTKAAAKATKKLRKAPPPPKYRKVCRYVFPYPKCIDLFSLRPEPYCIKTGGACRKGNMLVLLLGMTLVGLGAYLSFTIPVHLIWYNFEDDECCDDEE